MSPSERDYDDCARPPALTQEQLAELAGISAVAIGKIERGERQRPYPYTVRTLARALSLSEAQTASLIAALPKRGVAPDRVDESSPQIPIPPAPIIGREHDIIRVCELLRADSVRLLTLTGAGGVGKTRLAAQIANDLGNEFPDGAAFVSLEALTSADLVLPAIARTLSVSEAGHRSTGDALRGYLYERCLLLVLDNFEHLLDAATEIAEVSAFCPGVTLLITSRAPLRVRGEQEYPVAPLDVPRLDHIPTPEEVQLSPAIRLFLSRARLVNPEFALTQDNVAALAAICRRLDGLPLALELAAVRIRTLSPTMLLARLDRALPVLSAGPRDLPTRQQTMEATVRWSYELLRNDEQVLFERLSVFSGGWTLEAAEVVGENESSTSNDVLNALEHLVEQSLVVIEPGDEMRYRFHEPIRQFARDLLRQRSDATHVRLRHADYFASVAAFAARQLVTNDAIRTLDCLEADQDNLRTAIHWALEERPELAARMAWQLSRFYWHRGNFDEVYRWMHDVQARSRELPPASRAEAIAVAAMMRYRQGDPGELISVAGDVATMFRGDVRKDDAAAVLMLAGSAAITSGELGRAERFLHESQLLYRETGSEIGNAEILIFKAAVPLAKGEFEKAANFLERGLAATRRAENPLTAAVALHHLAVSYQGQGQYQRATRLYGELLELADRMRDMANLAYALIGLAECAGATGDLIRAARLFGSADELFQRTGITDHPFGTPVDFHQRYRQAVRQNIGEERWMAETTFGRSLTITDVIDDAVSGT